MDAYFEDIEDHIVNELRSTSERLLVAAAWFTNQRLAHELVALRRRYVDVEIVVDDNPANRKSSALQMLATATASVSFVKNLATDQALIHNKKSNQKLYVLSKLNEWQISR